MNTEQCVYFNDINVYECINACYEKNFIEDVIQTSVMWCKNLKMCKEKNHKRGKCYKKLKE